MKFCSRVDKIHKEKSD